MRKVIWLHDPIPESVYIPDPNDCEEEGLLVNLDDGSERIFAKWTLRTDWIQFTVWLECE